MGWLQCSKTFLAIFLFSVLAFVTIEGLCSAVLFAKRVVLNPAVPYPALSGGSSAFYLTGDPLLGWVNRPGVRMKDAIRPGDWIENNSQGFRSQTDFSSKLDKGQTRVLCSGDSFTFGFGVGNDETWCHQLGRLSGWQTVNLGMNGYGIDQSFLRYRREAENLEHQIHVFAFPLEDIERIRSEKSFFGSPKPVLELTAGGLQVRNRPVADAWKRIPWILNRGEEIRQLKSVELFRRLLPTPALPFSMSDEAIEKVSLAIFRELQNQAKTSGRQLLLVEIPTLKDLADADRAQFRGKWQKKWDEMGIARLDLLKEFQKIPLERLPEYFIPGDYHFSAKGNTFVAERVLVRLKTLERVPLRTASRETF